MSKSIKKDHAHSDGAMNAGLEREPRRTCDQGTEELMDEMWINQCFRNRVFF